MSKSKKIWLIVAATLCAVGILTLGGAVLVMGAELSTMKNMRIETNEYFPEGEIENIRIETDTANISLEVSEDGKCRVVCHEETRAKHTVRVTDGILCIQVHNEKVWYDYINISFEQPSITVYLPEQMYTSLSVDTDTGDVQIPSVFFFDEFLASTDTGNISCKASVALRAEIETDTGDVSFEGARLTENIKLETDTGRIHLKDISCKGLKVESATGDIKLERVIALEAINVKSSTGNVRLLQSDAAQLRIQTSTGDVSGTLLTEKQFHASSSTGNIDVPQWTDGGRCEIKTSTGNISVKVESQNDG